MRHLKVTTAGKKFSGMGESWTGGRVEGGSWRWEGGAPWTADLAPPPTDGHCLLLGLGGGWGGAPCQQQRGALCELQPDLQLPEQLVTGENLLHTCSGVHILPRDNIHPFTHLVTQIICTPSLLCLLLHFNLKCKQ